MSRTMIYFHIYIILNFFYNTLFSALSIRMRMSI